MGTLAKPHPMLSVPPGVHVPALLLLIVGLAALFVPTYLTLASDTWSNDAHGHGPLILGVCLWLLWFDRHKIFAGEARPAPVSGFALMAFGLLVHVFGHSQSINMFTTLAQPVVFAACILLLHGWPALRRAWFPLCFMLFMVPLPEVAVQAITMPLKQAVSVVTEWILYHAGYPIARAGVTLSIGPYQLLVADACSGMNSLLTLESLGLLYMRLMNYTSKTRNTLLAIAIIPTSFAANVIRVIILVLVTYHYGDEVGQGFVHSFSGLVLFTVSLVSIYFIDKLLGIWFKPAPASQQGPSA
ncbi:MAG: exosortase B [Burkholderiales bacterium]|nr:exosortase B [Burkholderiales bacterium]MBH2015045.1 exosortase B [Burkholderiales bacterium]